MKLLFQSNNVIVIFIREAMIDSKDEVKITPGDNFIL